jgi:hypothetical protein
MASNTSSKGINNYLQKAIELAEEAECILSDDSVDDAEEVVQPEEYESLVWGQSIWSTDVPKES